ncbi:unnamed protein product [Rotaria magnacalcarata]|uniref:Uncharacterized protein n=1 Tax=Rotaria magnacalcarata TaxID=392030 RepID=A0A816WGX4_9BILA|nr:unnamed protein product [Rotaria magnacalcarata]
MYSTCVVAFIKQKQIICKFFNSSEWMNMKNTFINNRKYNWKDDNYIEDILHIVIVPIYKEDPLVIDNILQSLAEQNASLVIGIASEEREINSDIKYNSIIHKYENKFLKAIKTIHPNRLENEVASKSSNCSYCAEILVKYYENNLKNFYNHAMITVCNSIWCQDYFLYLNYLSVKNDLKYFNHIVYTSNITNFRNFRSNHLLTNWMSIIRLIVTHRHFRFLGYIRCFTSEYHIPLKLLKQIDYWDTDLVHEDVHMCNKLAILDKPSAIFKSSFLPCDNQTPTNINSMYQSFILLWNQSLRWKFQLGISLFMIYNCYLFHQLLLNLLKIKNYENFQINSWKIFVQIINNYENLFFYFLTLLFNSIFWIFHLYLFNHHSYNCIIDYLLTYIQLLFYNYTNCHINSIDFICFKC